MEIKVVISLDEATQEIVKNLTAAIAGVKREVTSQEVIETLREKPVQAKKRASKQETEEKDFADEIAEIDAKLEKLNKKKESKVDTDEPTATIEEVRAALAAKKRAGFGPQIKSILKSYGVSMVSDLDPADYKKVINEVEELA